MTAQTNSKGSIIWENDDHTCRIVHTQLPERSGWVYAIEINAGPDLMEEPRWNRVPLVARGQAGSEKYDDEATAMYYLAWALIKANAQADEQADTLL